MRLNVMTDLSSLLQVVFGLLIISRLNQALRNRLFSPKWEALGNLLMNGFPGIAGSACVL